MGIKLIGALLVAAAGILPAVRVTLRERRRLAVTDSFLSLCRFAMEQISAFGATIPEILSRAGEVCAACGAERAEAGALLLAAENSLPSDAVRAVREVFGTAAGTREQQLSRCREAVRVMEQVRETQAKQMQANLRMGTVRPLSAAGVAWLLLW